MHRKTELLTVSAIGVLNDEDRHGPLKCSATQDLEPCTDNGSVILMDGSRLSLLNDIITLAKVGDTLHRGFVPQGFVLCNAHMAQANNIVRTVNRMIELAKLGDRYTTWQGDDH